MASRVMMLAMWRKRPPQVGPAYRPVWDLNCDGEVRSSGQTCADGSSEESCYFEDLGEALVASPSTSCGFGDFAYLPPITCSWDGSACVTSGTGPGGRPCR